MHAHSQTVTPESLLCHADFVRGLAGSLLDGRDGADDVLQDTFVTLLTRPPRLAARVRSWAAAVTRNRTLELARGEGRRRLRERAVARPERTPSTADIVEREALRREVIGAVLALDEPYRSAVLLRFYEDLPPRRMADRLGIPVETARTRVKRGLGKLRVSLDQRFDGSRDTWSALLLPLTAGKSGASTLIATTALASLWPKVALGVVIALAGYLWLETGSAPSGEQLTYPGQPVAVSDPAAEKREVAVRRAPLAATPPSPTPSVVEGRVVDERGAPLDYAMVVFTPDGPPELPTTGSAFDRIRSGAEEFEGNHVFIDDEGRFTREVEDGARTYVCVYAVLDPRFALARPVGRWVEPPATGVELVVPDAPTATLVVTAREKTTGEELTDFTVWLRREDSLARAGTATGAYCEEDVPLLARPGPTDYTVTVDDPRIGRLTDRRPLMPGGREEVTLLFEWAENVRGRVVDSRGAPVPGALVFFGRQMRLRGDEPFKPFKTSRINDGVLTGEDGRFELSGSGHFVTAWHDTLTPVTVARAPEVELALKPRAVIRGRVLDGSGEPEGGVEVALDRATKATTDADGRFLFGDVVAGVRGLALRDGRRRAVRVGPGEELDVVIDAAIPAVSGELTAAGAPLAASFDESGMCGLDDFASFCFFDVKDGRFTAESVVPGRYLLLSFRGLYTLMEVSGDSVVVDVGDASLVVEGSPGATFYAVPAGANELVELMCERVSEQRIPSSGQLEITPFPAGRFELVTASGRRHPIEVGPGAAVVRIE